MHILYPTDGSPGAAAALDELVASVDFPGLVVEVLAVVDPDLIAIRSRGLSGVERFLLGGTSGELVALAPTSLLVARS